LHAQLFKDPRLLFFDRDLAPEEACVTRLCARRKNLENVVWKNKAQLKRSIIRNAAVQDDTQTAAANICREGWRKRALPEDCVLNRKSSLDA